MAKRKSADTETPGAGETDGVSGMLHPRRGQALFGHSAAEEMFLRAYRAGALHHAWLLTGEEGIGKATFAYRASRFLLSRDDENSAKDERAGSLAVAANHPAARQIAAGSHPSLFVLGNEAGTAGNSASIGVEAVRKLRGFVNLTSPGGWRALIVDAANDLTISSANALLKAIEEPPPRTVFFLISHGAAAVMPTIRSRCVKLAFRPLEPSDFRGAVSAACAAARLPEPDSQALDKLRTVSAGSPGRALEFIVGGLLALSDKLNNIVAGLPAVDYGLVHELIQSASGARNAENFSRLCDLIEERIAEKARAELGEKSPSGERAAAWAELWHRLRERRLEAEALNLDKGAFLMSAFSDMEDIARKP